MSEVSLGSWLTLGSSLDPGAARQLVHKAYDLGINLFDSADIYADGAAERALGGALCDIPRRHVVIATKCFFPVSERANDRGLSRKHIFESAEASLSRLGTDYIDLFQCHRPDATTPVEETVCAFEDLIRQGKILYWGVSEWSAAQIVDACRTAQRRNAYRPISNQPRYSILRRDLESEILPVSEREGLGQIAFSPLGQGVLTGKYSGGRRPAGSRAVDDARNTLMDAYLEPAALERVDALTPLADELGISLAQLALAWCLRWPSVSSVIVGATSGEQLEENTKASGMRIPAEIEARIDEIAPPPEP